MKFAYLPAVAALLILASPAAAHPRSGLSLTDAVARKAAATLTYRHADAGCLQSAAQSVTSRPGVEKVAVKDGQLRVTFSSPAKASKAKAEVASAVTSACAQARVTTAANGPAEGASEAPSPSAGS